MHFFVVALLVFAAANLNSAFERSGSVVSSSYLAATDCSSSKPGEFSVCAEDSAGSGTGGAGGSKEPAMRECRYFANGSIDVPTLTVITAWVAVGSRLCIGDEVPKPSSTSASWQSQVEVELKDKFTALAARPMAFWSPGGELEFGDPIELRVLAQAELITGALLGRAAQIRFRPVSARWELTDGSDLYGFQKSHSFDAPGTFFARALVSYEVDYKHGSSDWVNRAASWELSTSKMTIVVIEKERRTLLVG
jgi:hypothetical protein